MEPVEPYRLGDHHTVNHGAVAAAEVFEHVSVFLGIEVDTGMLAGDNGRMERDLVLLEPPDSRLPLDEKVRPGEFSYFAK